MSRKYLLKKFNQVVKFESLSEPEKQRLNKEVLDRAYKNKSQMAYNKEYGILGIAGTDLTKLGDLEADASLVIPGALQTTERYQRALVAFDTKDPPFLVGHSLGARISSTIYNQRRKVFDKYKGGLYLYNDPTFNITDTRPHVHRYRHEFDLISMGDQAATSTYSFGDPHSYH